MRRRKERREGREEGERLGLGVKEEKKKEREEGRESKKRKIEKRGMGHQQQS